MDVNEANAGLRTVATSRDVVRAETGRSPLWYAIGVSVAIALLFASGDLNLSGGLMIGLTVLYVAALAVMLTVVLRRSRVRPHPSDYVPARFAAMWGAALIGAVVVALVPTMLIDATGVPYPGTVTGIVVGLLFLVTMRVVAPRADRWARVG